MKLQHLRFFTAVVECGGVIKAAERLHISQPAVSAGIKALEDELGGPLFDRGVSRKLSLTPAGRRFYRQAQEILEQCEVAKSDFAGGAEHRRVRIGVLDTLPQGVLIRLLERLAARCPDWRIELWEGSIQRLSSWLGQGRLELALTHVHGDAERERPLWRETLLAVVPPGHPWALRAAEGVQLNELAAEPFLHRSRCELDALGRAQLRAAGISLRVIMRGERDDFVFEMVRRGIGITLAPQGIVPPDLMGIPVAGLAVNRSIGLQWHGETGTDLVEIMGEELAALHRHSPGTPVAESRKG
jgi:DNA-binding transcriptional LysR family regulator